MGGFDRAMSAVLVAVVAAYLIVFVVVIAHDSERRGKESAQCEVRGGVLVKAADGGYACVRPVALSKEGQ